MALESPRAGEHRRTLPLLFMDDQREHLRKIAEALRSLFDGKFNSTGTFTLTANADSTTISHMSIGRDTVVVMFPTTANASTEKGNGTIYQTYLNTTKKEAIINHANNSGADRVFSFVLLG